MLKVSLLHISSIFAKFNSISLRKQPFKISQLTLSAADVKMEITALVRSLKSRIMSSTSFQMGKTFWGVASAAVEQSRRKVNMFAQGDGKFGPRG